MIFLFILLTIKIILLFFAVPSRFPVDEELINLCMIDHIQRMGLANHFNKEIEQILGQVYKNQMNNQNEYLSEISTLSERLYKDSLAFRLLRLQGYKINEGLFRNEKHSMSAYLARRKLFFKKKNSLKNQCLV